MKRIFLTVAILIFVVTLAACDKRAAQSSESLPVSSSSLAASSEVETATNFDAIVFPAYKLASQENNPYHDIINSTPKFTLNLDLPESWVLKEAKGDETIPTGEFYTPLYIYDGKKLMGYIGFNCFEPYLDEISEADYYKTVYPTLRLSSVFHWDPYTAVKTTDTGETGIANVWYLDPTEIDNYPGAMASVPVLETLGILSYDKTLKIFIGIAFMPDVADPAQVEAIAQSISLAALA